MKLNKREKELWNMRIDLGTSVTPLNVITFIINSYYRNPRRREEKGAEHLFQEITTENFPNLRKETNIQIQRHRELPSKSTKAGQYQDIL